MMKRQKAMLAAGWIKKSPAMYNKTLRKYIMETGLLSIDIEDSSSDEIFCKR